MYTKSEYPLINFCYRNILIQYNMDGIKKIHFGNTQIKKENKYVLKIVLNLLFQSIPASPSKIYKSDLSVTLKNIIDLCVNHVLIIYSNKRFEISEMVSRIVEQYINRFQTINYAIIELLNMNIIYKVDLPLSWLSYRLDEDCKNLSYECIEPYLDLFKIDQISDVIKLKNIESYVSHIEWTVKKMFKQELNYSFILKYIEFFNIDLITRWGRLKCNIEEFNTLKLIKEMS